MRLLSVANLRWVVRHRAWTPYYLKRYWRFAWFKLRHPQVITEGFVFLGKHLEIVARPGHGRIVLGKWVHLGDETRLRAHEGTLRIGDKVVFAREVTVNCYLDIEIGASTLIADWTYICDFDHKTEDLDLPIKDQGLVKSPVSGSSLNGIATLIVSPSMVTQLDTKLPGVTDFTDLSALYSIRNRRSLAPVESKVTKASNLTPLPSDGWPGVWARMVSCPAPRSIPHT